MNECLSCYDEIVMELLYRDVENGNWKSCPYCENCINWYIQNQWDEYVNVIKSETCKKTLQRLLKLGPPTRIREPSGLPTSDPSGQIWDLKSGNRTISAKLDGVYVGEKMEKYKIELKEYLMVLNNN